MQTSEDVLQSHEESDQVQREQVGLEAIDEINIHSDG